MSHYQESQSYTDAVSLDDTHLNSSNEITIITREKTRKVVSRDIIAKMSNYVNTVLQLDKEAREIELTHVDDTIFEFIYGFMEMYAHDPNPFKIEELPRPVPHRHLEYIVPIEYAKYVSHTSVNGSEEDLSSPAGLAYRRKMIDSINASNYLDCQTFLHLLTAKIGTTLRYYTPEQQKARWGHIE